MQERERAKRYAGTEAGETAMQERKWANCLTDRMERKAKNSYDKDTD